MSQGNILLVEDSVIAQTVGRTLLEKLGFTVDVVGTGESAIEHCHNQHYQLIFMDIGLPGMDGIETATVIRQTNNPNHQAPIIVLTANEDAELKARAVQAGINDYLVKPLTSESASSMVEKYVDNGARPVRRLSY